MLTPAQRKERDETYVRNCEMIRTLMDLYGPVLSTREKEFLDSIEGRLVLSPKQQAWLDNIWDDCFFHRNPDDINFTP